MQGHLFAWSDNTHALRHLCRYNQEVFKKKENVAGMKDFSAQIDKHDFRIMAAALVSINTDFYVAFGTSSGHLIL